MTAFNAHPDISPLEQLGRWVGRAYRRGLHQQGLKRWMRVQGVSGATATSRSWIVRVLCLGVLVALVLSVVLAVALLTAVATAQGIAARQNERGTWRNGLQGFGLYKHGVRTDAMRHFEADERR